jgi:hypothetical protein
MRGNGFKGKTYEEIFGEKKANEIKKKQSIAKKNYIPWNKGKKGVQVAWNKGKENPHWKAEKNPRWNPNKIDNYNHEFTKELKEKILKRDNYTCQNIACALTNDDSLKKWGANLSIHHIDRNKKNNKEENLVSLCRICHSRLEQNTVLLKNIEYKKLEVNKYER